MRTAAASGANAPRMRMLCSSLFHFASGHRSAALLLQRTPRTCWAHYLCGGCMLLPAYDCGACFCMVYIRLKQQCCMYCRDPSHLDGVGQSTALSTAVCMCSSCGCFKAAHGGRAGQHSSCRSWCSFNSLYVQPARSFSHAICDLFGVLM